MRQTTTTVLAALAIAVSIVSAAVATDTGRTAGRVSRNTAPVYHESRATAEYRSALDGGDNADITAGDDPGEVTCTGYQAVAVGGLASVSGATVEICLTRVYDDGTTETQRLSTIRTLTADDTWTEGASYIIPASYFDTHGATEVEVRAADPSSGTATLRVEVY